MDEELCTFCPEPATYRWKGGARVGRVVYGQRKVPLCAWHLLLMYLGMHSAREVA